jgi:hypothetical protein
MRRLTIISIILSLFAANLAAQEITVTSGFDTTRIYIGDQINFTVAVEQPKEISLAIPVLKDTICDKVEILAGPVTDTSIIDDQRIRVITKYLVTSFDSGFYVSQPIYADAQGTNGTARYYSGYSRLEVSRVSIAPADTTDVVYDIVAPYGAPVTIDEVLPWVLLAVLIALALYGLYRLIYFIAKKRLNKGEEEIEIPREPAHIVAYRELEILHDEELWQKGEIKEYYSRLTGILRQYLDNRYGINSLELTTAETLEILVKSGFKKDEPYTKLKMILDGSDLVKFAKHKPGNEIHESFYDETRHFVDVTMEKTAINGEGHDDNAGNKEMADKSSRKQLKNKEEKR